jgi:glyoxylase-like metal-dependent hydrolase (beta-lactamase superfamily II)
MKVGAFTIDFADDGSFVCPVSLAYPNIPEDEWKPYERFLVNDGKYAVMKFGTHVIRGDDDRITLVDLGFGPAEVPEWNAGKMIESLAKLGVQPEEVTDILFTHLHFDHIGWTSVEQKLIFPNARYHCDPRDWEHFTVDYTPNPEELTFPDEMLPENKLAPIADSIVKWDEPGEVLPGISIIESPGHSPGHCCFEIASDGEVAFLIGDVSHNQTELMVPDWQDCAAFEPDRAKQTRNAVAELLAVGPKAGSVFSANHFGWGRLTAPGDDGIYGWEAAED